MKKISLIIATILLLINSTPAMAAPLRVSTKNPRYLEDDGKAVLLVGSHTWCLIHTCPDRDSLSISRSRMVEYLDFMESHGHNFVRFWANNSYLDRPPFPWTRPGPGTADDGLPKFDMTKYDQAYFDRLRDRVEMITDRGMYASVVLFGSNTRMNKPAEWEDSVAWNENQNINPELASAFSKTDGATFYTDDPEALAIQKALVKKNIDTLNHLDNIIWEISNESKMPPSHTWQDEIADYIREYESTKPKQHLIAMNVGGQSGVIGNDYLFATKNSDIVSPNSKDVDDRDYHNGGPAGHTGKVVLADTDHLYGFTQLQEVEGIIDTIWKNFTRGNNVIFMDGYDANFKDNPDRGNFGEINPVFDPIRDGMGKMLYYAEQVGDIADMEPSTSLCQTDYCLVNPGQHYVVYQPGSSNFWVELPAGDYEFQWYDTKEGADHSGGGPIKANGGRHTFDPPGDKMVLFLKKSSINPGGGGDVDGDGDWDGEDVRRMKANFGKEDCSSDSDVTGDCVVDIFDYNKLVSSYGS